MEDNNSKLSNRNEIYIVGLRSINEAIFTGGHSFSLGLFYSLAYHKTFDIDGYPICKAGFYDLFSDRPSCKTNSGVPRFIARAQLYFDLLWLGNLNLMASFIGMTQILDIIKNPTTLFDIVYSSKPLWRYLSWFISFNSAFGGLFHLDRELVNARTSTGEAMFTIGIKSEL